MLRLGWSLTGRLNHPATAEATGLEVDKLDRAAVERYMTTYLDMFREAVGPELLGARGVRRPHRPHRGGAVQLDAGAAAEIRRALLRQAFGVARRAAQSRVAGG